MEKNFPPLTDETRPAVDTVTAAYYLNRRPQTLRGWACLNNGPIKPMNIGGRLAWPVADLKRLLGVEVQS
ncbi:MAG TPA: DNA-binding protein [Acidovorax sp.]|nr:DNA-binding protein [Acidovorax sp.]